MCPRRFLPPPRVWRADRGACVAPPHQVTLARGFSHDLAADMGVLLLWAGLSATACLAVAYPVTLLVRCGACTPYSPLPACTPPRLLWRATTTGAHAGPEFSAAAAALLDECVEQMGAPLYAW